MEVVARDQTSLETGLNTAVETVRRHAMRERRNGIMVTQHSFTHYTVAISREVPYGQTREQRAWDSETHTGT
ncbi:hypothetical protein [Pseudarthrobacter raffinosi]|uniref:hypothetical protein n=1 Tax=Pseudarthrobacter raffinosi TaxID=2953651 RepID=UPI00208EBD01|nr:hypothetical protein [Pseudarthrobacter sp. MDT3-9]MCO4252065.1 hypothetical protein [Pseudarthrobacter sp. MDT3-9]